MSSKASIPTQLYQANVDLAVRIAALLQENGRSWIGLFTDVAGLDPMASWPDAQGLGGPFSLEKLATMPAQTAASLFRGDAEYWKNLLTTAVRNQHQFAQGLRDAVEAWQVANRKAIGKAGGSVANLFEELPGMVDLFGAFRQVPGVPRQAVEAVLKTTLARKPASRPAPAKPVPSKAKAATKPAPEAKKKPQARKAASVKATPAVVAKAVPAPAPAAKKAPAKKPKAAKRLAIVQSPRPML